jgi:hypothetical protein
LNPTRISWVKFLKVEKRSLIRSLFRQIFWGQLNLFDYGHTVHRRRVVYVRTKLNANTVASPIKTSRRLPLNSVMPDAAIMNDRVDGRLVLEHEELRPAFECGDVIRANTESYGHSYNDYGIVSVSSGDDYSALELGNAPENRAKDCPADVVADLPEFNFVVNSLSIRRNVGRQLMLEDLENIKYVCSGSNSLIFSAIWNNQDVVVKVMLKHNNCR